jgi:nicotinamidase-related amidase
MPEEIMGSEMARSALILADMQNDFLHPDRSFAHIASEHREVMIDMHFLVGTIPHVKRLVAVSHSTISRLGA